MYELKRIVVSVNLSDLDEEVIRYASIIADMMDADTIYFLHVAEDLNLPEEVAKKYAGMMAPVDETIRHQVRETVGRYFSERETTESVIDILEGKPTDQLLKYARRKEANLIIAGRPPYSRKLQVNIGKVAELSNCSVLLVPKQADIKIENLVVAMDFSSDAESALEQALQIARAAGHEVKVYGHHVYHVPHGFYKTGKSYEEFAAIMLANAKKEAHQFFKKSKMDESECIMTYSLSEDDKIHDELNRYAVSHDADMILVGSRGRSAVASMLLGSVSERLLHYDNNIPVFVVKDEEENMGFLEALFKL